MTKANLLSSFSLLTTVNDSDVIENIIFNQNHKLVLRCSAIEAFIYLYPNKIDYVFDRLFTESVPITLLRLAISSLSRVGCTSVYSLLCKKIDASTDQSIVIIFLRVIVLFPSSQVDDWLIRIIEASKIFADIHLHAVTALAATGSKKVLSYLEQYLAISSDRNIHVKILVYKALSTLAYEESIDILVNQLTIETNILVVTQIIESLSEFRHSKVEQALLMCLTPNKWPKAWPPPQSPIKKGEQKPSDRRKLSAIIGLNRILSNVALPILKGIAEDSKEPQEIRDTAYLAVYNISWR